MADEDADQSSEGIAVDRIDWTGLDDAADYEAEEDRQAEARIADGERIARGSMITLPGDGAIYHVTAVRGSDVYGHSDAHCDASGCAGDELRLGRVDDPGIVSVSHP